MDRLRSAIVAVADEIREDRTCTLRQLYYALTVRGVLEKTEADYKRLANIAAQLRRDGVMPYAWIEDGTRVTWAPATYASAQEALAAMADRYLESPWPGAEVVPEIWLEKDALAGVVFDVASRYCVPLRVLRGYASLSALHRAYCDIVGRVNKGISTQVYYLRDLDPSGADAARAAEEAILDMFRQGLPGEPPDLARVFLPRFRILGVTPEQVRKWKLPTRPNKTTDSRSAGFAYSASVELDAIEPVRLRELVTEAIECHIPEAALRAQEAQVESTREYLRGLAMQPAPAANRGALADVWRRFQGDDEAEHVGT